jgi:dephospho-CoA kinase
MIKVGLTGNFHSGHRNIINKFEELMVPVFDADLIFKFMINYDDKIVKKIENHFGNGVYKYCLLDFKQFDSNKKFEALFELIKEDIFKCWHNWKVLNSKSDYTIFLSSVLFELKLNEKMDFTINVLKEKEERKKYLMTKTTMPLGVIESILNGEMNEKFKTSKADYIITNSSLDNLDRNIKRIHKEILSKIRISDDNLTTNLMTRNIFT